MDAVPPHFLQPFPAVDDILRHARRRRRRTTARSSWSAARSIAPASPASIDRRCSTSIITSATRSYGAINWIDESAAACGELVFTLIEALGAPLTPRRRDAHLSGAPDRHRHRSTSRTSRRAASRSRAAASKPAPTRSGLRARTTTAARSARVQHLRRRAQRRCGSIASGRVALLTITQRRGRRGRAARTTTPTGIINFPLSVKDIQAVAFFKEVGPGDWRVSMRSKGAVDVGAIARSYGGGGHKNAAGCSASGELATLQETFLSLLVTATRQSATETLETSESRDLAIC